MTAKVFTEKALDRLRGRQIRQAMIDRVQGEALIAHEIRTQHPDISRDEALRTAAEIYLREERKGRRPA